VVPSGLLLWLHWAALCKHSHHRQWPGACMRHETAGDCPTQSAGPTAMPAACCCSGVQGPPGLRGYTLQPQPAASAAAAMASSL
jgi:hypothetical protein